MPIRNKRDNRFIEIVSFADDASKIQRIYDNLGLDYVASQAGEATVEKVSGQEKTAPTASVPGKTETIQTNQGAVEFEVGSLEDNFNISSAKEENPENFTAGRAEKSENPAAEKNPSAPSSPSKSSYLGSVSREQ